MAYISDIYDPLTEYVNVFRDRFKDIAEKTFEKIAKEANIDAEANRKTCKQIYAAQEEISALKSRISLWGIICGILWASIAVTIIVLITSYETIDKSLFYALIAAIFLVLLFLFAKVHPTLKKLKGEKNELEKKANALETTAWKQMEPLNRLYDWDILTRMMSETVPRLEFDPYFTVQRLLDLKEIYGWNDSFNAKRSVLYSHSGLINGNPFVLCRTKKMNMGEKTYYGSKTIYWTTMERDSEGRLHSVQHSETLTASVTAPYPEYYEKTRLIYGNTAAPDLIFYRSQSGLAGKEKSSAYKHRRNALRKEARDLSNRDFAMMSNEEFEIVFDTRNRNNNQQFALLFTPLAQESMINLLKDEENGYGDDFDFDKKKMINTIIPEHLQVYDLDFNPEKYKNFDFEKAKSDFCKINSDYFRAIYFSFAPLLCVPMYQQIRSHEDIYGIDMQRHSAFWEHEALANFLGQSKFEHPSCVTQSILKTSQEEGEEGNSTITVYAYGYRVEKRVSYIEKWGGDGKLHQVPVNWDEYLPVTGTGKYQMKEDNDFDDKGISQCERLSHINDMLVGEGMDFYRRHIASKVKK